MHFPHNGCVCTLRTLYVYVAAGVDRDEERTDVNRWTWTKTMSRFLI